MLFTSSVFIFQFLPIVLCLFFLLKGYRSRLYLLLLSSLIFYGYWNVRYLGLLFFSIVLDFYIAIWIEKSKDESKRKALLILSICCNLGILFLFKYFNFFISTIQSIGQSVEANWLTGVGHDLILPVGISFYTFQSLSYTIDIYRGHSKAHRDFTAFFTYVSFFPQLIAGPIIRYSDLLPQLEDNSRIGGINLKYIEQGILFFVIGFAKKILIADRIGVAIDPALLRLDSLTGIEAWICIIGYSIQLYFDFSGYSDMAVGLGKFFHLDFPQNFNSPYKAGSITDFWRRWHISLSTWLRDYLYISLGGNRRGRFRNYLNLLLTMLLGGLWHGASFNFIIWGGIHGLLLSLEKAFGSFSLKWKLPKVIKWAYCFLVVCFAWIFFRAPDLASAFVWLNKLFDFTNFFGTPNFPGRVEGMLHFGLVAGFSIAVLSKNTFQLSQSRITILNSIWLAFLFVLSLTYLRAESPFLYFQF